MISKDAYQADGYENIAEGVLRSSCSYFIGEADIESGHCMDFKEWAKVSFNQCATRWKFTTISVLLLNKETDNFS